MTKAAIAGQQSIGETIVYRILASVSKQARQRFDQKSRMSSSSVDPMIPSDFA
jgi:hypothetical protein